MPSPARTKPEYLQKLSLGLGFLQWIYKDKLL